MPVTVMLDKAQEPGSKPTISFLKIRIIPSWSWKMH